MVPRFSDPFEACRAIIAESYRLWLQHDVRLNRLFGHSRRELHLFTNSDLTATYLDQTATPPPLLSCLPPKTGTHR